MFICLNLIVFPQKMYIILEIEHFNYKFQSNVKTKRADYSAQSDRIVFFTLDWSNFILHDAVRIFSSREHGRVSASWHRYLFGVVI